MENHQGAMVMSADQAYNHAYNELVYEGKNVDEVKQELISSGLDEVTADVVVNNLLHEMQEAEAKKRAARKDMLFGGLWCVGGTIATLADVGFIFWGAIVFGGIQFFRGLANAS